METSEMSSEGKIKDKKPRKRMKAIYHQIKEQMEFYFSDSNLNRDRFMKKQFEDSKDGFLNLDLFLKFNKIKNLTEDTNVIASSLKNSELLQVSEDGQKVKRTKPVSSPKDIDDRTVYVECLPHHIDHDWIRRVFSRCGPVLYVSIPRYKSTGDPKGFAFIEFDSRESAEKACEEMNNPPAEAGDKPGKFPRTSKQLSHLQKSLSSKEDVNAVLEKSLPESPTKSAKKRKRRHQTSECSIEGENVETITKQRKLDLDKELGTDLSQKESETEKQDSNISKSEENEEKDGTKKKNKKRKKSKGEGQSSVISSETSDQFSVDESDKESRKRKKADSEEEKDEPLSKVSKKEKDNELNASQLEKEKGSESDNKNSKLDTVNENKENSGSTTNSVEEKSNLGKTDGKKDKKKKKTRSHKSKNKDKEIPELRVISKREWLDLKAEYLKMQKESMNQLKKTLTVMKKETDAEKDKAAEVSETKGSSGDVESHGRRKIEFIPNVIVGITSGRAMYRKELKEDLGADYQIAYIDIKDGEKSGFIRMKSTDSAQRLSAAESGSYFFTLLQGQEEKDYWDKLEVDRNNQYASKSGNKKRGTQKLLDKAQKISKENIKRTHVKFDD